MDASLGLSWAKMMGLVMVGLMSKVFHLAISISRMYDTKDNVSNRA